MEVDAEDVAGLYRRWGEIEARGSSSTYERLCAAVAEHGGLLALLAELPRGKRQPNLLFGVLRLLGADVGDAAAAVGFAVDHWTVVRREILARGTQTNEPARCAVMLPALGLVEGPVAVLEIGASAGLCLLYDRYRYEYEVDGVTRVLGSGPVTLPCRLTGAVPVPEEAPTIVTRLGVDAHPLDAGDPATRRWLECLVWPEHTDRAARLSAALEMAAAVAPPVIAGLAPRDVPAAVERVRERADGSTVVVTHSAVAAYLDPEARRELAAICGDLGVRRIGLEGPAVTADLGLDVAGRDRPGRFLLTLDDRVLGHADPHGWDLVWF